MADERTLVLIRERTFLNILDLALVVARRKPRVLGLAALAGILPFELLNSYLFSGDNTYGLWLYASWLFVFLLEAPLITAPLTVVLGSLMFGRKSSVGRVAATLARASFSLVFYSGVIRICTLFTILLSPLIPARMMFMNEAILLERSPWNKILDRSGRLSRDRGVDLIGMVIGQFFFGLLFLVMFRVASRVPIGYFEGRTSWSADSEEASHLWFWAFRLSVWLMVTFFAIVRFLVYIDQRIRLEGWAITLRLRAVGAAMEEAEKW